MKYEVTSSDYCKIFVNNLMIKNLNFHNEKDLEKFLKEIILSLKNKYNLILKGLYQITISINKNVGAVIEIEKIETFLSSSKDVDLHIKVIFDCKFYFRTKDFYVVESIKDVYYYNNCYYVNASTVKDILSYIEFGDILEGRNEDIEEIGMKVEKI